MLFLSICLACSCNKDSNSSIIGTWNFNAAEFYYDSTPISFDSSNDAVFIKQKDGYFYSVWTPVDVIRSMMGITFMADGTVTSMGLLNCKWRQEGGKYYLMYEGDESNELVISGVKMIIKQPEEDAYGYAVVKNYDYGKQPSSWLGEDGGRHSFIENDIFVK